MKKAGIYLFKLFGFSVRLDWTWFFLAILITWTLAIGYFPLHFPGLTEETYWLMGISGAVGLFLSIILHELSHSLVGRLYNIPISGITLFIFGGVAEMHDEPPSPKAEFFMAIVGPVLSIALGILFKLLFHYGVYAQWPMPLNGIFGYLGMINLLLGIFNLLPGFPLDGGRVLRSILWWWKGDLKWATNVAAQGGTWLGFILIFFGIFQFIQGAMIAGLWTFLIGFFLQSISKASYQQLLIKEIFQKESIKKYAKTDPICVESNITLQDVVDHFFYQHYYKFYPVVENKKLVGCISFNEIKEVEKEKWPLMQVKQIMQTCSPENTIDAETDVSKALEIMNTQGSGRMLVMDHGKFYGIITLKDLMDVIFIKLTL